MRTKFYSILLVLLSLMVADEGFSFLYLHYFIHSGWLPDYLRAFAAPGPVYLTEHEPWGAWRASEAATQQVSACFSVALRSNWFGMRDREREVAGDPHRTVVLGDSFAEGWGVEQDQRLTDLLQARLGREFLNFGIENDVGPLQYQILYNRLASRFAHDQVLIMFLPDNDFTDNDASFWRRYRPDFYERYRPYYEADGNGDYRPYYPTTKPGEAALAADQAQDWLVHGFIAFRRNSWAAGAFRYLRMRFSKSGSYSGYLDFSDDEMRAVLWSFHQIKEMAGKRQVTILVMPRLNDFRRVDPSGDSPLMRAFTAFGRQNDVKIVDLLPLMPRLDARIDRYFLPCDGHWSADGNRIAADALLSAMHLDVSRLPDAPRPPS